MTLPLAGGGRGCHPPGALPLGPAPGEWQLPSLLAPWGHGESPMNLDLVVPGPVRESAAVPGGAELVQLGRETEARGLQKGLGMTGTALLSIGASHSCPLQKLMWASPGNTRNTWSCPWRAGNS